MVENVEKEINELRKKLEVIKKENQSLEESNRLGEEEFVIDIETDNARVQKGIEETEALKKEIECEIAELNEANEHFKRCYVDELMVRKQLVVADHLDLTDEVPISVIDNFCLPKDAAKRPYSDPHNSLMQASRTVIDNLCQSSFTRSLNWIELNERCIETPSLKEGTKKIDEKQNSQGSFMLSQILKDVSVASCPHLNVAESFKKLMESIFGKGSGLNLENRVSRNLWRFVLKEKFYEILEAYNHEQDTIAHKMDDLQDKLRELDNILDELHSREELNSKMKVEIKAALNANDIEKRNANEDFSFCEVWKRPESVDKLLQKEIFVEKYYTKDEKKIIEEEKRRRITEEEEKRNSLGAKSLNRMMGDTSMEDQSGEKEVVSVEDLIQIKEEESVEEAFAALCSKLLEEKKKILSTQKTLFLALLEKKFAAYEMLRSVEFVQYDIHARIMRFHLLELNLMSIYAQYKTYYDSRIAMVNDNLEKKATLEGLKHALKTKEKVYLETESIFKEAIKQLGFKNMHSIKRICLLISKMTEAACDDHLNMVLAKETETIENFDEESFSHILTSFISRSCATNLERTKLKDQIAKVEVECSSGKAAEEELDLKCNKLICDYYEIMKNICELDWNPQLLLGLREGQSQKPKHDDENVIIVTKESIIAQNEKLEKLAEERIKVLTSVSEMKKKIESCEWELEYLRFCRFDCQENYADLHMVKVTKSLQQNLQKENMVSNLPQESNEEAQEIETKVKSYCQLQKQKLSKKKHSIRRLKRRIEDMKEKNSKIREAIKKFSGMSDMNFEPRGNLGKKQMKKKEEKERTQLISLIQAQEQRIKELTATLRLSQRA
eukprot:augustus_masked-scaffold_17-processed-gene-6.14-mRNA-1 protein AED:1.00 eAED:1.00 QI:0/-1/0/0/-1/1/1/0/840